MTEESIKSKLIRTQQKLKRWTRKLKLAQTKVLDLKRRSKYYEKRLLESHSPTKVKTVKQVFNDFLKKT